MARYRSERALRALFADVARMGYVPMDLFLLIAFNFFTLLVPPPRSITVCAMSHVRVRCVRVRVRCVRVRVRS